MVRSHETPGMVAGEDGKVNLCQPDHLTSHRPVDHDGVTINPATRDMTDTTPPADVRTRLIISGRVQGVYFRAQTKQQAEARGLRGWVRNLPDGRVEAVVEGDASIVEQMIAWCHRGPSAAHVTDVQVNWEAPTGETTFSVRDD